MHNTTSMPTFPIFVASRSRFYGLLLLILCSVSTRGAMSNGDYPSLERVGVETIQILNASKAALFEKQPLINTATADKSTLFGNAFLNDVERHYTSIYKRPFPQLDHPVKQVLVKAMLLVLEDNRALILDKQIDDKGFIPAVFTTQVAAKMSTMGLPIILRWSAPEHLLFNPLNKPLSWEKKLFPKMQDPRNKDQVFVDVDDGVLRTSVPLFYDKDCLACHTTSEKNAYAGKTRFPPRDTYLNQFAGAISVAFDIAASEELVYAKNNTIKIGLSDYHVQLMDQGDTFYSSWQRYFDDTASRFALSFDYVTVPRGRLNTALTEGLVDIAFPLSDAQLGPLTKLSNTAVAFEIPGLCYLKEDYMPYSGVVSSWQDLIIVTPSDVAQLSVLEAYAKSTVSITGANFNQRAFALLKLDRADAFFTSDVNSLYMSNSTYYDELACSKFGSYSTPLFVAARPGLSAELQEKIRYLFDAKQLSLALD